MKKLLVLLLAIPLLAGCPSMPQVPPPPQSKLIAPEDHLLIDCLFDAPPEKETYPKQSPDKKEDLLINYSQSLLTSIATCNQRFKGLRDWKVEQKKIHENPAIKAPDKAK